MRARYRAWASTPKGRRFAFCIGFGFTAMSLAGSIYDMVDARLAELEALRSMEADNERVRALLDETPDAPGETP
jgi:hypothetical protein